MCTKESLRLHKATMMYVIGTVCNILLSIIVRITLPTDVQLKQKDQKIKINTAVYVGSPTLVLRISKFINHQQFKLFFSNFKLFDFLQKIVRHKIQYSEKSNYSLIDFLLNDLVIFLLNII